MYHANTWEHANGSSCIAHNQLTWTCPFPDVTKVNCFRTTVNNSSMSSNSDLFLLCCERDKVNSSVMLICCTCKAVLSWLERWQRTSEPSGSVSETYTQLRQRCYLVWHVVLRQETTDLCNARLVLRGQLACIHSMLLRCILSSHSLAPTRWGHSITPNHQSPLNDSTVLHKASDLIKSEVEYVDWGVFYSAHSTAHTSWDFHTGHIQSSTVPLRELSEKKNKTSLQ